MATLPQVGPLVIVAPCRPQYIIEGVGFVLPCGGKILNVGKRVLHIDAEVFQPNANCQTPASSAPLGAVRGFMPPLGSVQLQPPPAGWQWSVEWISQRSLLEWAAIGLGAFTVVGGLAGIGIYDLIRIAKGQAKKRRR